MDKKLFISILNPYFLIIILISTSTLVQFVYGDATYYTKISSCNQTPHPHTCTHFLINTQPNRKYSSNETLFRDMAFQATLAHAVQTHQFVAAIDWGSLKHQRAPAALADCVELYLDAVDNLNRSMKSVNARDAQTLLSAAVANHETCRNGFRDLNITSVMETHFPDMLLGNLSKLLGNSLAINAAAVTLLSPQKTIESRRRRRLLEAAADGFPEWVTASDRKLLQLDTPKADVVVAQDGSGNFMTITEAVAGRKGSGRFVIYVKKGVYKENVEIKKTMENIMVIGDGMDATVVTGSRNVQDGSTTFRSATFAISGQGFIARDITFMNTAGPQKHQAVALRSRSDFSVFYRCSFKGYQDTLYLHSKRQFYRECHVYGTVDFIFGDAAAVLQGCNIYVRRPMDGQSITVTAQARSDPNENTGIVIHNSRVEAGSDLAAVQGGFKSYLGRPWKEYSRTVYMKSVLGGFIDPAGWLPWSGDFALQTLYYAEFMNTGSGSGTSGRVKWAGYHVLRSAAEAEKFTVGNFLAGGSWITGAGVPYDAGL